mmetsp:Transcript_8387/g.27587  ORF Transcript_8387/g.27587 Transcript_8387/m.27587 type:complete len:320 (-) Transcript_8387:392-1351(-)
MRPVHAARSARLREAISVHTGHGRCDEGDGAQRVGLRAGARRLRQHDKLFKVAIRAQPARHARRVVLAQFELPLGPRERRAALGQPGGRVVLPGPPKRQDAPRRRRGDGRKRSKGAWRRHRNQGAAEERAKRRKQISLRRLSGEVLARAHRPRPRTLPNGLGARRRGRRGRQARATERAPQRDPQGRAVRGTLGGPPHSQHDRVLLGRPLRPSLCLRPPRRTRPAPRILRARRRPRAAAKVAAMMVCTVKKYSVNSWTRVADRRRMRGSGRGARTAEFKDGAGRPRTCPRRGCAGPKAAFLWRSGFSGENPEDYPRQGG